VKARKGPAYAAGSVAGGGGFLSRRINQVSVGILGVAMLLVGIKMVKDMFADVPGSADASAAEVPATVAPEGTTTAAPSTASALSPADQEAVTVLMADGIKALQERRATDAATAFYKVLAIDPANADAERMGYVACEALAIDTMHAALKARKASEAERAAAKATALERVAAAAKDGSQIDAARTAVESALALNANDPDLIAAQESLDQRQASVAHGAAVAREEKRRASLADRVAAGQREFDRGNYAAAVQAWEGVMAADATRAAPEYYQAEEQIRLAKDRMKTESKRALSAGLAAAKQGDLLSARNQLAEVVRIDPYNESAATKLAEVKAKLREQASSMFKEARVLEEEAHQFDKALALYQKVLTYVGDPSDPLAQKAQTRMNSLLQ
jgi:hypothetical protein